MIRALTILATASLALPVGHYIDDALGTGVRKLNTTGALAAPVAATDEPDAGAQVSLLYRGAVKVGEDGNGVEVGSFPTTLGGIAVRYVLVVENGCTGTDPVRCPAPVSELTVTLNDEVVFQNDDDFAEARRRVALNSVEAEDNQLVIAANGAPRSAARVLIIAIRHTAEHSRLYRGAVTVGKDGNGVEVGSFPTTVGGRDVRYVLAVENGCAGTDPVRCPAPVRELTVTLNDDVVFQEDEGFTLARHDIALNAIRAEDNRLLITASGSAFSGARVSIFAVQHDTSCEGN